MSKFKIRKVGKKVGRVLTAPIRAAKKTIKVITGGNKPRKIPAPTAMAEQGMAMWGNEIDFTRPGWFEPLMVRSSKEKTVAFSLSKGVAIVAETTGTPAVLGSKTLDAMVTDVKTALQGVSDKSIVTATVPAAGLFSLANLTRSAAYRVRITDSLLRFLNGKVSIACTFAFAGQPARSFQWVVYGIGPVYDFVVWSVSNNNGVGKIMPADSLTIGFNPDEQAVTRLDAGPPIVQGTMVSIESINNRDLGWQ